MKPTLKKLSWQFGILFFIAFVLTLIFSPVYLSSVIVVSLILSLGGMLVGHSLFWLCKWRRLKWIFIGIGCLIGLLLLGLTEENIRTHYKWKAHKHALEQKGEHFDLSYFVPPVIPDDQNFTMTPLLKSIMDFKRGEAGVVWLDTNAYAKVSNMRAELQMKGQDNNIKAGSIERGTFADLKTYQEFYKGNTNYCQPISPGPAGEDILIALSKFDAELNELKNAAKTRPQGYWKVHYTDPNESVFSILLPHLAQIKGLAIFCQIHSIAAADAGLSQIALEDLMVNLRLSDSLKNTPILIDHLVRLATLNITMQGIREGLYRHTWNAEQLLELEKQLEAINLLAEAKVSLRGERAMNIMGIDQLRRGIHTADIGVSKALKHVTPFVSCVFYQNMITISELHQETIELNIEEQCRLVYTNRPIKMREFQKQRKTPYNVLAGMLMPAYERVTVKVARTQTMVDAAKTACALERHRLKHGSFPETIDGPTDVMDGKPLRYRKTSDGGYILYSIGWNCADDGGVTVFKKSRDGKDKAPDSEQGDWIWPMPNK